MKPDRLRAMRRALDEVKPVGDAERGKSRASDLSEDKLAKLKAHEASARKIGNIKEADAFLSKIRQDDPSYKAGEGNRPSTTRPPRLVFTEIYRKCRIEAAHVPGKFVVITDEGNRQMVASVSAAKKWIDDYWSDTPNAPKATDVKPVGDAGKINVSYKLNGPTAFQVDNSQFTEWARQNKKETSSFATRLAALKEFTGDPRLKDWDSDE